MTIQQCNVHNKLLQTMPSADFALLQPHLRWTDFALRHFIGRSHQRIETVVFFAGHATTMGYDHPSRPGSQAPHTLHQGNGENPGQRGVD